MLAVHLLPEDGNHRRYADKWIAVLNTDTTYRKNSDWVYVLESILPTAQRKKLLRNPSRFYLKNRYSGELAEDFAK